MMPIIKKINIAILYAGEHIHRNILPVLLKNDKFNLIGIYLRSKKNFDPKYKKYYKSKFKILDDPKIDTIYISSPNSKHKKDISLSLLKSKNVICEKPICLNSKEFKQIKKLYLNNNKIVFEAFMFVYHDISKDIFNFIKKNKKLIKNINAKFLVPDFGENNIRYDKKLGGGAFYDLGCYLLKFLSLIIKKSKIKKKISFKFSPQKKIDTYGSFKGIYNNFFINLEWGIGFEYENFLEIELQKKKKIIVKRFFSKDSKINSTLELIHNGKIVKKTKYKKQNHFNNMLNYYYLLKKNKLKKKQYFDELENHQNIYLQKIPF